VLALPKRIIALVLLAAMVACSVTGLSQHAMKSGNDTGTNNCSSACSSHGQHIAINSHTKSEDDDEKEPVPPLTNWNSATTGLTLLYLAPIGVAYWILTRQKQNFLSVQMRF